MKYFLIIATLYGQHVGREYPDFVSCVNDAIKVSEFRRMIRHYDFAAGGWVPTFHVGCQDKGVQSRPVVYK